MAKTQKIIEAAITVFSRDGLEKGKIADIAVEAGIGKGTIYEYFSSKEDIFAAIETHMVDHLVTSVFTAAQQAGSAEEKLKTIFDLSVKGMLHLGDALLIVTEILTRNARGHIFSDRQSPMSEMYTRYRQAVETILQEGMESGEFRTLNPAGSAALFMAFIDGIVWQYVFMPDKDLFNRMLRESLESYLRGIRK
ncbi:MAG: TetR/AcrR family transcriptional regulator [Fidelibacterota bacterium]